MSRAIRARSSARARAVSAVRSRSSRPARSSSSAVYARCTRVSTPSAYAETRPIRWKAYSKGCWFDWCCMVITTPRIQPVSISRRCTGRVCAAMVYRTTMPPYITSGGGAW